VNKSVSLLLLVQINLIIGCQPVTQVYYLSPSNATSNPYHAIPFKKDSVKKATYVSVLFNAGTANDDGDNEYAFRINFHRSQNFGNFQAYYGLNAAFGRYSIAEFKNYKYQGQGGFFPGYNVYDSGYLIPQKNAFFGSVGFNGGINLVIPFREGEWRPLGLETSIQKEFGDYLNFRKNLPDTAATVIFRSGATATLGIYTDIIGRTRHGTEFGYKFALGMVLNPTNDYSRFNNADIFPLSYLSNTFHLTKGQITGFLQFNFGTYATNFQTGVNFNISKKANRRKDRLVRL
jgi:hypothetical protein